MKKILLALALLGGVCTLAAPARSVAATFTQTAENTAAAPAKNADQAGQSANKESAETPAETPDEKDQYRISHITLWVAHALNLPPRTTAFLLEILNFLILFAAIGWGLKAKLPPFFRDRSGQLKKQLVDARTATEDANKRLAAIEGRLAKLDDEIISMRQSAERDVLHQEERFREMLEQEKDRIVTAAEQEIESAGDAARRNLKLFAADLAVASAEKRLKMTPELDGKLMDEFLNSLEGKS